MGAYWKTLRVDTYFIKDGHLKKNLNVLGVDTYLINVRKGAYLITLNWIGAYTKMTYYIRTSVVTCRVYCGFEAELLHIITSLINT